MEKNTTQNLFKINGEISKIIKENNIEQIIQEELLNSLSNAVVEHKANKFFEENYLLDCCELVECGNNVASVLLNSYDDYDLDRVLQEECYMHGTSPNATQKLNIAILNKVANLTRCFENMSNTKINKDVTYLDELILSNINNKYPNIKEVIDNSNIILKTKEKDRMLILYSIAMISTNKDKHYGKLDDYCVEILENHNLKSFKNKDLTKTKENDIIKLK